MSSSSAGERGAAGGYVPAFTFDNFLNLGARWAAFKNTLTLAPTYMSHTAHLVLARDLYPERLVGDGLVPLDSALGRHGKAPHTLHFPKDRQWIGYGMGHLELLNRPEVYSQLNTWMQDPV